MRFEPLSDSEGFAIGQLLPWALHKRVLCKLKDEFEDVIFNACQKEAILIEEHESSYQRGPLVAIVKWVIMHQAMEERGSCHFYGRILQSPRD